MPFDRCATACGIQNFLIYYIETGPILYYTHAFHLHTKVCLVIRMEISVTLRTSNVK